MPPQNLGHFHTEWTHSSTNLSYEGWSLEAHKMGRLERFAHAATTARASVGDPELAAFVDQLLVDREAILSTIEAKAQPPRRRGQPANSFGLIVAPFGRVGPAASYKLTNIAREVSRTLYAGALFAMMEVNALDKPTPVKVLASLISFTFAAFAATRATISYNDACVLHAAWKIAGARPDKVFTRAEIRAAGMAIAKEYRAPKCDGEKEIDDVLENLLGLKAIAQVDDRFVLKERVVFHRNGNITN